MLFAKPMHGSSGRGSKRQFSQISQLQAQLSPEARYGAGLTVHYHALRWPRKQKSWQEITLFARFLNSHLNSHVAMY